MRDITEYVNAKDMTADEIAAVMLAYPASPDSKCADQCRGLLCSLAPGHDGPRAAYGGADYLCALWPDQEVGA